MSSRGGGRGRRGGRGDHGGGRGTADPEYEVPRDGARGGGVGRGAGGAVRGRGRGVAVPEHGCHRDDARAGGAGRGRGRGAAEPEHVGGRGDRDGAGRGGRGVAVPEHGGHRDDARAGGAGRGRDAGAGRGRGRGAAGPEHGSGRGAGRGSRGAGDSGGQFHAPQPAGGRGGYHGGVAHGRGPVAATTAAEVEDMSRHVERKMAVTEAPALPRLEPSSSAPTPAQAPADAALLQGMVASAGRLPPASSKALVFPARPGYGKIGRRCRVRANHFLVQTADTEIYHYDVCMISLYFSLSLSFNLL
jgi:eukaryotic translation initiation factor 2C